MKELEIVRHRQIDGLSIFFDTVEYRTPHFHSEWELIWITEGALEIGYGADKCTGREGDLFLFYPGQVHEFRQLEGRATFLCLQILPDLFLPAVPTIAKTALKDSHVNPCCTQDECAALRRGMQRVMRDYLECRPFYELSCVGQSALLLHGLLKLMPSYGVSEEERIQIDKRNARLERFIRFVDENYTHKISLSEFAGREGCTTSYMSRFIKSALNQNFQQYVGSVRYHSACRMIESGETRMLDVCQAAGYSDYRYFSKAFRQHNGLTPEEYARQGVRQQDDHSCRSLHSVEQFYSKEQSEIMTADLRPG